MADSEKCSLVENFDHGASCLERKWSGSGNLKAVTTFTVVWNLASWGEFFAFESGIITVNGIEHTTFNAAIMAEPILAILCVFPLIGLMLGYYCCAQWFNKTRMKFEKNDFVVKRGPFPWGAREIRVPTIEIKQAFIQEYSPHSEENMRVLRYRLMVQTSRHGDMVLESGIGSLKDAEFLEQWLEGKIGIKDVPVPGEVGFKKAS
jgi:hypothetical protein